MVDDRLEQSSWAEYEACCLHPGTPQPAKARKGPQEGERDMRRKRKRKLEEGQGPGGGLYCSI